MNRGLMSATTESIDTEESTYWTRPGVASGNCFLGYQAGKSVQVSQSGIASGSGAGAYNTFIGYQAGLPNTTGDSNVYVGYQAGYNITGISNFSQCVVVGYQSYAGGNGDVVVGKGSAGGGSSVALGIQVDVSSGCVGIGNAVNADSPNGIAIGNSAQARGTGQISLGYQAGFSGASGSNYTVFIGNQAGYTNTALGNIFVGYQAGYSVSTATGNIHIGQNAGTSVTSANNTMLGYQAGYTGSGGANATTSGAGQTLVGYNTGQAASVQLNYIACLGASVTVGASGTVAIGADHTGVPATTSTQDEIAMGTAIQTFHFFGGLKGTTVTKASNYAMNAYDFTVLCNGAASVVLPPPTSGAVYRVKNIAASAASVYHNASETIDGVSAIVLGSQYEAIEVTSDGTNWFVVGQVASTIL